VSAGAEYGAHAAKEASYDRSDSKNPDNEVLVSGVRFDGTENERVYAKLRNMSKDAVFSTPGRSGCQMADSDQFDLTYPH
jgi:hypothetical protein